MRQLIGVFVLDSDTRSNVPPTSGAAFFSALGYFTVAVASTWAGFAVGHQRVFPSRPEIPAILSFLAMLFPAYVSRGILYELKHAQHFAGADNNRAWLRIQSVQLPAAFLAISLVLTAALVTLSNRTLGDTVPCILARIAVGVLPLYLMGAFTITAWPFVTFRARSFFPAFATCLIPFAFGYATCQDLRVYAATSLLVIAFWIFSFFVRVRFIVLSGALLLVALAIGQILSLGHIALWASVLFFGTTMTLAMGVSESWRVTTRILNDQDLRLPAPYTPQEKRFYLGGANLATALFLPLFLLTFLHPSTKSLYLPALYLVLGLQYVLWFYDTTPTKRRVRPSTGVVCGLMIPVIIFLGTNFGRTVELPSSEPLTREFGLHIIIVTCGMITALGRAGFKNAKKVTMNVGDSQLSRLIPPTPCICITGILSSVLSIAIILYGYFSPYPTIMGTRMVRLNYFYMLTNLSCFLFLVGSVVKSKIDDLRTPSASEPQSGDNKVGTVAQVRSILRVTRITPAVIAGLLAALLVSRGTEAAVSSWWRAGLAMALVTMVGFVVDNIYDASADRESGIRNPLATGTLSVLTAKCVAVLMAFAGLFLSPHVYSAELVLLATLLGLIWYPAFTHRFPLTKGFYTGLLVSAPLAYGMLVGGIHVPFRYFGALIVFIIAREAFLDSFQADIDRKAGNITVAVKFGRNVVERLAGYTMVLAAFVLVLISHDPTARTFATLSLMSVGVILYGPIPSSFRPGLLRLPMCIGAVAIGLGA